MKMAMICLVLLLAPPRSALAQLEWATWGAVSGNTVTATFESGPTATLTSFFDGISNGATAGTEWNTVDPAFPGRPDGTNPPLMRMVSGSPHPVVIANGAQVLSLDLLNVPIDTLTTVGFSDFKSGNWYYLHLQNSSGTDLSLLSIRLTHFNMKLAGSGWDVDFDLTIDLNSGFMLGNGPHQVPGAFYDHSGVVLIDHLPPQIRRVVVTAGRNQDSEGLTIYLGRGASTPVEPATWSGIKRLMDR